MTRRDTEDGEREPGWELGPDWDAELEITDVLDLHSFRPSEVKELVAEYLDQAHAAGLTELRIIHGKGVGVQRRMVRALLERDPRVLAYGDPPGSSGGWGATWVTLKKASDP